MLAMMMTVMMAVTMTVMMAVMMTPPVMAIVHLVDHLIEGGRIADDAAVRGSGRGRRRADEGEPQSHQSNDED